MAQDSSQIVIPGTAAFWLSPVGTAAPADETTAPASPWRDAGLTTEDGTTFAGNPTFGEVRSHQSPYPTRVFKSTDSATLNVIIQQFNGQNLITALGGGTLTVGTAGHFKYAPPGGTSSTPTAAMFDWSDTYAYRLVIPKCRVRAGVNVPLRRTGEVQVPLALEVEGGSAGDPWYLLTNDPMFDPTANP